MTATLAEARGQVSAPVGVLPFGKYHGAGNDFVIVDGRAPGAPGSDESWVGLAGQMCDRHFGVGADGLLVACAPTVAGVPPRMRMFNPDGSESEMCGNGLRCFVRWLQDRREVTRGELPVETGAGVLRAAIDVDGNITVDMGRPRLTPQDVPLSREASSAQPARGPALHLDLAAAALGVQRGGASALSTQHSALDVTCVSMGNPHAVAFVPDVAAVALEAVGPRVERHPAFPARTNFEVCEVLGRDRMRVRVWERGAGLTLACGTGACAAMVAARLRGLVDEDVSVALPGGTLRVEWQGGDAAVFLSGPVVHVFDGTWRLS